MKHFQICMTVSNLIYINHIFNWYADTKLSQPIRVKKQFWTIFCVARHEKSRTWFADISVKMLDISCKSASNLRFIHLKKCVQKSHKSFLILNKQLWEHLKFPNSGLRTLITFPCLIVAQLIFWSVCVVDLSYLIDCQIVKKLLWHQSSCLGFPHAFWK